jgi:hypothetical protein
MVKYVKFLLCSFLAASISSLYTMQEIEHLSKKTIKDMILKYQFDKQSVYLASLLSLPRQTLLGNVDQSLKQYQEDLQEYHASGSHYTQDLAETKKKISTITTVLNYTERNLVNSNEPYIVLSKSLSLQKCLVLQYERAMENEKRSNFANAQNTLDKMTFLLEALYLTATTPEQLSENSRLYKQLSLRHFHPDKIKNEEYEIQEQKGNYFKTFQPLLGSDAGTDHLNNMIKAIHEKRSEAIERINNPSALTSAAHFLCSTTLPVMGHGLGAALCHKTFAQVMPRSKDENVLRDICVASARKTALEIETKLVKIPYHP